MRILQVIHDFLPLHAAGSEVYTGHLCRALRAAGHDVSVFTCEEHLDRPQHSLLERTWDGFAVHEAVYNRQYSDLSEQWDDPKMVPLIESVLESQCPDLVHVQGLQFVGGVSALKTIAARGIPMVMTLHEYWWLCPRSGLMYDVEGRACEHAEVADCVRCVDLFPIDRDRWSDERCGDTWSELGDRRWFARALEERVRDLADAVDVVGCFLAPSRFLAERYSAAGIPIKKIRVADYGFPPVDVPVREETRCPLRVGFVGTCSDYKGVEVLAEAAVKSFESGADVEVSIYGSLEWFPELGEKLAALAEGCPALKLPGPFEPDQQGEIYRQMDVLVVPSLWWENSPLTIHEAWQFGVPVVVSDRGGMAELASRGGAIVFPPGDVLALAEILQKLSSTPKAVEDLRNTISPVRDISEDVALLEEIYQTLA